MPVMAMAMNMPARICFAQNCLLFTSYENTVDSPASCIFTRLCATVRWRLSSR